MKIDIFNRQAISIAVGIGILFMLIIVNQYNFLLFHILVELFSIIVATGIFMLAWNSSKYNDNSFLLFIGITFLFIAGFDLLHTISYKGMGVFQDNSADIPTQLWIIARYMESISLLFASVFLTKKLNLAGAFAGYSLISLLLLLSVFHWRNFPTCFDASTGLTTFKIISEYIISFILLLSIIFLIKRRTHFEDRVFKLLVVAILLTIASELSFTHYVSVYGPSNQIGHFLKLFAFFLIYKAVIETGLMRPYDLLFRNLNIATEELKQDRDFIENLIETAPAILLVLDRTGILKKTNSNLEKTTGYSRKELIGKDVFQFLMNENARAAYEKMINEGLTDEIPNKRIRSIRTRSGEERIIEWFYTLLSDESDSITGSLALGQDVTVRIQLEKEQENLIVKLQNANEKIETLSGLIPICSSCKKIRDDKGFWNQFETYISSHAEVQFSHGICPDCLKTLYPDYADVDDDDEDAE